MRPREMQDRFMKQQGWTHRRTDQTAKPYLKLWVDESRVTVTKQGHGLGATFTNQEQQFYFILWDRLVTL